MPAIDASRQHAWTMKALTRLLFAIAIFALLACGDGTPVLELDDEGKPTEASLAMLRESAEDEAAFNEAFQSLILAEVLREMHDADNGLAGLAAVAAIGATGEDAMLDRAKHVYKRLEGLSSSEIITASQKRAAEMETKRELEQLEREQARQAYLGRLAAKVEFSATDFRVVAEEWVGERRYVDVTLTNNGDEAISGLTFKAEVRSPGRSVPWEDDDGMQVWFDGGIEGGESQQKGTRSMILAPSAHTRRTLTMRCSLPLWSAFTAPRMPRKSAGHFTIRQPALARASDRCRQPVVVATDRRFPLRKGVSHG